VPSPRAIRQGSGARRWCQRRRRPASRPYRRSVIRAGEPALGHDGVGDRSGCASSSRINSARWRKRRVSAGSRGGERGLDLFQHPRQCDGEGEEGAVEIGGVVHFGSYSRLSRPLPASGAGAGGSKRAVGRAELFAPERTLRFQVAANVILRAGNALQFLPQHQLAQTQVVLSIEMRKPGRRGYPFSRPLGDPQWSCDERRSQLPTAQCIG